jgi:hypothetical protein
MPHTRHGKRYEMVFCVCHALCASPDLDLRCAPRTHQVARKPATGMWVGFPERRQQPLPGWQVRHACMSRLIATVKTRFPLSSLSACVARSEQQGHLDVILPCIRILFMFQSKYSCTCTRTRTCTFWPTCAAKRTRHAPSLCLRTCAVLVP